MKAGKPERFPSLAHRPATGRDVPLLAELNTVLIRDEGSRNPMGAAELEARMRSWLSGDEYRAVIFSVGEETAAYALYRELGPTEIYLRQFLVVPARRGQGLGRACVRILAASYWPRCARVTVDVLSGNEAGLAFWRRVGFSDYTTTLEFQN